MICFPKLMIVLIYLKIIFLFIIIFFSGIIIARRAIAEQRPQIIIPTGIILGLGLFLFITNLLAHLIKGLPLFYITLFTQALIAYLFHIKFPVESMEFPQKRALKLWLLSLFFWGGILGVIVSTSPFNGGHDAFYHTHATVFLRGDYPIHTPWQPDYIGFHHLGASQLLGSIKALTGADYYSIQGMVSFFMIFAWSQIITWLILKSTNKLKDLLVFSIPAFLGIISVGGFIIAYPQGFSLPMLDGNFFSWFKKIPGLEFPEFGQFSAISIDAVILFFHRVLSTSFFLGTLAIILNPSKKYSILVIALLTTLIASMALTDESVLIGALPAIALFSFYIFNKNIRLIAIFLILTATVLVTQGGIITELILNRYHSGSGVLILPEDRESPYEKFRSWRLKQQSSYLYAMTQTHQPLRFFHPGIVWQLSIFLLLITLAFIVFQNKQRDYGKPTLISSGVFLISSIIFFIAYHAIVPYPFHTNGWRLLSLSYQFSGIGIGILLGAFLLFGDKKWLLLKILIIWILIFSLIPPFIKLFPRRDDLFWVKVTRETKSETFKWIESNLSVSDKIIALTDTNPIPSTNTDLVKQVGIYTPIWDPKIRAHDIFDTNPAYADLFYTLNPSIIKILKPDYILFSNSYLGNLPEQRKLQILNEGYFKTIYTNSITGERIVKIMSAYLQEAEDFAGTLEELRTIAPKDGIYFIDHKSTSENLNLYRSIVMTLRDRKFYGLPDYWNGRVDVYIPFYGYRADYYDYLVLGGNVDPDTVCNCESKLIWQGYLGRIKLWKTNY